MPSLPLLALVMAATAAPPKRQVPPSVLAEVHRIEARFEQALAADCDADRCTSGGCVYGDHTVADRPRARSLPGLTEEQTGPGSVETQAFLTRAQCSFTHEQAVDPADVQALVRRLQARSSSGWTTVGVTAKALPELPPYFRDAPVDPEAEAETDPEALVEPAVEIEPTVAEQLWRTLLPHSFWMVGIGLVTLAALVLIWAARRVGRMSPEEQALLAELAQEGSPESTAPAAPHGDGSDEGAWVAEQHAAWTQRLTAASGGEGDPAVKALLRHLLRSGETALLAKAVLTFPDVLPDAFPTGGDVATAKLGLSEALQTVREADLPSETAFYTDLNRHALAAHIAAQDDTELVRALREDFGTTGLAVLVAQRSPRVGALLFSLAPRSTQRELLDLLAPEQRVRLAAALLLSDRMDPAETRHVFAVLRGARGEATVPPLLEGVPAQDQGARFGAPAALSLLLPRIPEDTRTALFAQARQRFGGSTLPGWYGGILTADMLLALAPETRFDLMLSVAPPALCAWLGSQSSPAQEAVLSGAPNALRAAVQAGLSRPSTARDEDEGRRALAAGLQASLARSGRSLADLLAPLPAA